MFKGAFCETTLKACFFLKIMLNLLVISRSRIVSMKNYIASFFVFFCLLAVAQQESADNPAKKSRNQQIGITLFSYRGYDFSKELYRIRDKYTYNFAPGIFYMRGNNKNNLRLSLQYSHVSTNTPLHYKVFSGWFSSSYVPVALFQRECLEGRVGLLHVFNADEDSKVHAYYATDLVYGYGRQKYAVVYQSETGNANTIGYQFNTLANIHTFGFSFDLNSDFCLYAETGFAIDAQFALRSYYYSTIKYFNNRTTIAGNFRVLQIGISKKFSSEK